MSEDLQARKRAQVDLDAIEELRKNGAFTSYFERRVKEEVQKRATKILEDRNLSPDELYRERLLYFAALDTARIMERDEVACRNILGAAAPFGSKYD